MIHSLSSFILCKNLVVFGQNLLSDYLDAICSFICHFGILVAVGSILLRNDSLVMLICTLERSQVLAGFDLDEHLEVLWGVGLVIFFNIGMNPFEAVLFTILESINDFIDGLSNKSDEDSFSFGDEFLIRLVLVASQDTLNHFLPVFGE